MPVDYFSFQPSFITTLTKSLTTFMNATNMGTAKNYISMFFGEGIIKGLWVPSGGIRQKCFYKHFENHLFKIKIKVCIKDYAIPRQGRLKIWREHSHTDFVKSKPFEI